MNALFEKSYTYGWLAPPSRNEPDWESAVTKFLGPMTQQIRQPGSLQFYQSGFSTFQKGLSKYEYLGEPIDENNSVLCAMINELTSIVIHSPEYLVYVFNVLRSRDRLSIVFGAVRIDVPRIELTMSDRYSSNVLLKNTPRRE